MAIKIVKRRLEWLGHIARMPDHRIPKMALFGWLQKTRPPMGPRKRWRDVIRKDLQVIGVPEKQWHTATVSGKDGVPSTRDCRVILASRNK